MPKKLTQEEFIERCKNIHPEYSIMKMQEQYQSNICNESDKLYLNPGDVVQLKQNIPYKPKMVVIKKVITIFKYDPKRHEDNKSTLRGIKCMWFTTEGLYQEGIFSTKDLELVKK